MPSVHAQRLERWVGNAQLVEGVARQTKGWYGPPIPIAGVPGRVYVNGAGDYVGFIEGGGFASMSDYAFERAKRILKKFARGQMVTTNTGFASLSDLISEATTGGKSQVLRYLKTGVSAPAAAYCQPLWALPTLPSAGANAGAAGGGTVPVETTAGGLGQTDPGGSDTLHLTTWTGVCTVAGNALMLYDYYFGVNNSLNATNTAVTGISGRYQDVTSKGTFCSLRVTTALSATATNLTLTYMDQDGNTAEAAAAIAARVSAAVNTIPLTTPAWFIPLNAGDTGLRKITNIASSGGNTGVADWFLGMPLAINMFPTANLPFVLDGINSAFNLVRVVVDACPALMEYWKPGSTLATYDGMIQLVSG